MRPVGPRVVTRDVGQLRRLGAVPLHDEDVEETRAVTAECQQLAGEYTVIEPRLSCERQIDIRPVGTHRRFGAADENRQTEHEDARDWRFAHVDAPSGAGRWGDQASSYVATGKVPSRTALALRAPDARANSVTRSLRSHSCRRHHHAAYSPRCCRGDRRGRRHDPVLLGYLCAHPRRGPAYRPGREFRRLRAHADAAAERHDRSEEHTSELQSHSDLVCRLLLEKKKKQHPTRSCSTARFSSHASPPPAIYPLSLHDALPIFPAAVAATGVVAATTLCCSDTSAPTRAAAPRTALVASSAASAPTLTPQQSGTTDRKSTRLNSSHTVISYAVFCLKKKKNNTPHAAAPPPASLPMPLRPPRSTLFPYTTLFRSSPLLSRRPAWSPPRPCAARIPLRPPAPRPRVPPWSRVPPPPRPR